MRNRAASGQARGEADARGLLDGPGVDLKQFLAEVGDIRRFEHPRQLMVYLGLVPSERSTGDSVRWGGITKTGNARVRRVLTESAWTYRCPAGVGKKKYFATRHLPEAVREVAWKAQARLTRRYRALTARGKRGTVAVTAVARGGVQAAP